MAETSRSEAASQSTNSGATKFQVRLVTPDRILIDQTADAVELPSKSGYMEALPGHAPLLSELGAGTVTLHGGEAGEQQFVVAWGFVEVLPERVTILAESAQRPQEIDQAAAQALLDQGHTMWNEAGDDADKYVDANDTIAEAEAKLSAAAHKT